MDFDVTRVAQDAQFTATGMELPAGLDCGEWLEIGARLRLLDQAVQWWLGDWLAYGERTYGKSYAAAVRATGYAYETVRGAAYVASRIESVRRRTELTFAHHREVAPLERKDQEQLLSAAEEGQWTRGQLRRAVKVHKRRATAAFQSGEMCSIEDLFALAEQGGRFSTIYADPPWPYDNQDTRASTDHHYSTMSMDEICSLPVDRIAADNAHLHLWTTSGFLFEARDIMQSWGFEYRSSFVWVKPGMGLGNYWRLGHELCLLGTRGSLPFGDRSQRSWREWQRRGHSCKPTEMYEIIEQVSPGPYLELFARSTRPGWKSWGDEIRRDIFFGAA